MADKQLADHGGNIPPMAQRWMLFVDGENLTIRAQAYVKGIGGALSEGAAYRRDTFLWPPGLPGNYCLARPTFPLQSHAIRAYYYTSMVGGQGDRLDVYVCPAKGRGWLAYHWMGMGEELGAAGEL